MFAHWLSMTQWGCLIVNVVPGTSHFVSGVLILPSVVNHSVYVVFEEQLVCSRIFFLVFSFKECPCHVLSIHNFLNLNSLHNSV